MSRRPPGSTRTDTLFHYRALCGSGAVDGDLPPAIPGTVPTYPEPPATDDIDPSLSAPPAPPSTPPAPPAPPVEKTVGAIGAATAPVDRKSTRLNSSP